MKYIDEFRAADLADILAQKIAAAAEPGRCYRFMEFCGGHTHAIARYGLVARLPAAVHLVHGPGCPVCVLPIGRIDMAIALALDHQVILCSYGDALRVPGSAGMSLQKARAGQGTRAADVRIVYSTTDALAIARANPEREVVFFAIGFETTTPPTALAILQAQAEGLGNFSVLCAHVLTPPAMRRILDAPADADGHAGVALDGFIGPAHVSAVIGSAPYEVFADIWRKPVVIAGFEPLDVLQAVLMLMQQVNSGRSVVENEFSRAVTRQGNRKAQACIDAVFAVRDEFEWRGLGRIPDSALQLRAAYAAFDAEARFALACRSVPDHKACECGAVLRGVRQPQECAIFGSACTPHNPLGACMVSAEGACAAWYRYGRHRQEALAQP